MPRARADPAKLSSKLLDRDGWARIGKSLHASQGFFARSLNVSASAVRQWESGAKRPSGPAAKLLAVVEKHGLSVLA